MATPDIAPFNKYIGNGATTQFSVGFPYIDTDFIHVYIKRADSDQEEVETTDWEWVNETTIRFPATGSSEAILADGEVLVIQRETPTESEFTFANQKRLFPEDVMKADDLEMQILQEQARDLARAIKVEPTSPVDPEELVNEVERLYESIDNIDTVAQNISDVGTVASNVSDVGTVADDIASVKNVSQNMSDVNNVSDNMSDVSAVSTNMSDINDCADNMAAILAAPAEAEKARIWAEGDDEEVVPLGGTHSAKGYAEQEANLYRVKSTGSTTFRALKDRFADIINVKDFGAKGDGVTDDTVALQTAIDYAIDNQKSLFIPSGTYNCTSLHSKGNFGHNNNMVLKITGDYKTVITLSGSFTIADRLACDFSNITFDGQSTTSATLKFGNYDYYCNRCSFRNIKIYGNPTAIEFVYAFDMGFWDCRISSHQTYAENVNEMPVVVFSKETNREPSAANQMVFCRCHFEGTAGNGTFIDMEDTYKTYAVSFLGCHFETRNLNSRAFHIKSGLQITFLGCEFVNNSYNASSDITDTHTKATNIIESNVDVAFYNCCWDRWDNKLINIDANTKGFKFYGVLTTSPTTDVYPTFSTFFGNATTYLSRWQIRIIQSNNVFYSNEGQELRTNRINFLHPNENSKEGSIEWYSGMGITTRAGNEYLTYQKSGVFAPYTTNSMTLGNANHLWKEVFAANATINTSDERQKQEIAPVDERVFKAWSKVEFKQFLFNDAVAEKGKDKARIHFGLIAQRVKEAFESEGLDGFKYGLLCYDEWDDEYEDVEVIDKEAEYDEDNELISPEKTHVEKKLVRTAGNAYGIRYGEALALECAYQRWITEKLEKRLEALEGK